jgi:ParB-like chromosome segregation protein Spo0J
MQIETKVLSLKDIKPNPQNPRIIKDGQYKKLVQSIKDYPEMTKVREIVVNHEFVIVGGNMRYRAMQEAGWTEALVKILPKDWTQDQINHFIIEDNIASGEWDWDKLANEWDTDLLDAWGLELLKYDEKINDNKEIDTDSILDGSKTIICPKCKFEFEK